ncbi:hypothetical protein C2845_PM06G19800 [Panicum miliaceum]|uniref:Uncharacterized protein n=1 Tax=Panicum miliaceum TaxID=4540 RepID=A0A3L6RF75_PANMI|nr:hypothetical protein C2845_PM06G19800 [Panicum miliaceum]
MPSETATLGRPRFVPARAQKYYHGHGSNFHPHVEPNHFAEERRHIWTHYLKIYYGAFDGVLPTAELGDKQRPWPPNTGQTHPTESLSEYAYNYDVKTMHREFNWQMTGLEDGIRNTPTSKEACKLVLPTILKGVEATESLVGLMVARRQRALGKMSKVAS